MRGRGLWPTGPSLSSDPPGFRSFGPGAVALRPPLGNTDLMRSRSALLSSVVLGLLAGALVLSGAGRTSAQVGQISVADVGSLRPSPGVLDATKRTLRVTKALQAAKLAVPGVLPTSLEMKVTPMAPRHSSGAFIVHATSSSFYGPSNGKPDGTIVLTPPSDPQMPVSMFEISFPTVAGKLYVADCRFTANNGGALKLSLGKAASGVHDVEDGHLVVAFAATATTSALSIVGAPSLTSRFGFYGCEIGKVD
jgi:hypothetical protein